MSSGEAPIAGVTIEGLTRRDAGIVEPVAWSCGIAPGERVASCAFGDEPGTYEGGVAAPGYRPERFAVAVARPMPACCPLPYEPVTRSLWLRPFPDPVCVARYARTSVEEALSSLTPRPCEQHPDLPPPKAASAGCANVLKDRIAPRTHVAATDSVRYLCGEPTSDGSGTLMVPLYDDAVVSLVARSPAFWGADGSWSRRGASEARWDEALLYARVVPRAAGFLAVPFGWQGIHPAIDVSVIDPDGGLLRRDRLPWGASTGPPADVFGEADGGATIAVASNACVENVFGVQALRLDGSGAIRALPFAAAVMSRDVLTERRGGEIERVDPAMTSAVAVGVDGDGRVLVTWEGEVTCGSGTIAGRWFDADGGALSEVFVAAAVAEARPHKLVRLLDGSLVLQTRDGTWARRFAGGHPAGGPVPAWLGNLGRGWDVRAVRGGRAYAAIPPDAACDPRIELRDGSGEPCGTFPYPRLPDLGVGVPCDPGALFPIGIFVVGFDGTVIRLRRWDGCEYEWWSRELE